MKLLTFVNLISISLVYGRHLVVRQQDNCNRNNCYRAVWGDDANLMPLSAVFACQRHLTTTAIIYPLATRTFAEITVTTSTVSCLTNTIVPTPTLSLPFPIPTSSLPSASSIAIFSVRLFDGKKLKGRQNGVIQSSTTTTSGPVPTGLTRTCDTGNYRSACLCKSEFGLTTDSVTWISTTSTVFVTSTFTNTLVTGPPCATPSNTLSASSSSIPSPSSDVSSSSASLSSSSSGISSSSLGSTGISLSSVSSTETISSSSIASSSSSFNSSSTMSSSSSTALSSSVSSTESGISSSSSPSSTASTSDFFSTSSVSLSSISTGISSSISESLSSSSIASSSSSTADVPAPSSSATISSSSSSSNLSLTLSSATLTSSTSSFNISSTLSSIELSSLSSASETSLSLSSTSATPSSSSGVSSSTTNCDPPSPTSSTGISSSSSALSSSSSSSFNLSSSSSRSSASTLSTVSLSSSSDVSSASTTDSVSSSASSSVSISVSVTSVTISSSTTSESPSSTPTPICTGNGVALCDGGCQDLRTSNGHCGACGNVCASGKSCVNGVCTSAPCDSNCDFKRLCNNNGTESCACAVETGGSGVCFDTDRFMCNQPNPNLPRPVRCSATAGCDIGFVCVRNYCACDGSTSGICVSTEGCGRMGASIDGPLISSKQLKRSVKLF